MDDQEYIYKIMAEHEAMKKTLQEISEYDPDEVSGYTDEWSEATGFHFCKDKAKETLKRVS